MYSIHGTRLASFPGLPILPSVCVYNDTWKWKRGSSASVFSCEYKWKVNQGRPGNKARTRQHGNTGALNTTSGRMMLATHRPAAWWMKWQDSCSCQWAWGNLLAAGWSGHSETAGREPGLELGRERRHKYVYSIKRKVFSFLSAASQLTSASFPVSSWSPNLFPFKYTVLCMVAILAYPYNWCTVLCMVAISYNWCTSIWEC